MKNHWSWLLILVRRCSKPKLGDYVGIFFVAFEVGGRSGAGEDPPENENCLFSFRIRILFEFEYYPSNSNSNVVFEKISDSNSDTDSNITFRIRIRIWAYSTPKYSIATPSYKYPFTVLNNNYNQRCNSDQLKLRIYKMRILCLKPIGFLHLILVVLSTFVIVLAKTPGEKSPTSSIAQPPIFPPVQAPQPHKGGGHHKKTPTPPPLAHPPTAKPPSSPPVKPPVKAPSTPPPPAAHPPTTKPPTQAPAPPPVKPPTRAPIPLPPRKLVAVQGVVYCKSCNYTGVQTLLGATPLLGAVVKLQCNNTKSPIVVQTKTDRNGYFFINAPRNITTYGTHKCRVFIVSSPNKNCNKTTNLHNGVKGAILLPSTRPTPPVANFQLFSVGPFAFESSSKKRCTR